MSEPLAIDGAHGEGGGQIVRTAITLAAITRRRIHLERIRAGRRRPGLAAQHVTAVRAAAALCQARLEGDRLDSPSLDFAPQRPVASGDYAFDVALAREGGSAGAAGLVLQTVLLPLALASGESRVVIQGGTHLPWSPPFDYLRDVWLPTLGRLGIRARAELESWGWFPIGGGKISAIIEGVPQGRRIAALDLLDRGRLRRVAGRTVAANLPAHIPQRMADRVRALLAPLSDAVEIRPERVRAACPGAGIFLTAEYENVHAGFSALGAPGKPSETVAEEAAALVIEHHASGAALDRHLGDQILLPLCLADRPSRYTVERVTGHFETNAWVIESFGLAKIAWRRLRSGIGEVSVVPQDRTF